MLKQIVSVYTAYYCNDVINEAEKFVQFFKRLGSKAKGKSYETFHYKICELKRF